MKKKILLAIAMIAILACLFAFSVSAAEWFGKVEIIDNDGDGVSDIVVTDRVPNVVTEETANGGPTTESALVKFNCSCAAGGHTFPAYYVTQIDKNIKNTCYGLNYDKLNSLREAYCGGTTAYTIASVVAFELPAGYTNAYAGMMGKKAATNLKYFSFAKCSTATKVWDADNGNNWVEATPIEEINFGSYLTRIPSFVCYNCDSLTRVVIPDQIEEIGRYAFQSCDNLTTVKISENSQLATLESQAFKNSAKIGAFYIPKTLTTFGVGGSGNSPIDGCKNLYFVNRPDETTKPSVYYFPSTITSIAGETFKNCTNLNDVLVFPSTVTEISDGWAFCNSNAISVVFLGNMTKVSTSGNAWTKGITLYFCNSNDKSASDLSGIGGNPTKVYCHADGNTSHLAEKTVVEEAKCETNAGEYTYCFCGYAIDKKEIEGTALEHNYDYLNGNATLVSVSYDDLSKDGKKVVKCGLCGKEGELTASKVIDYKGYSKNDKGAMCMGYNINQEALKDYESKNGAVTFGFVASANNNTPLEANGNAKDNVVKADLTGSTYTAVDFILTAEDWTTESVAAAKISINLYVMVNNAVKYVTVNGYSDTAEAYKYSDIQ